MVTISASLCGGLRAASRAVIDVCGPAVALVVRGASVRSPACQLKRPPAAQPEIALEAAPAPPVRICSTFVSVQRIVCCYNKHTRLLLASGRRVGHRSHSSRVSPHTSAEMKMNFRTCVQASTLTCRDKGLISCENTLVCLRGIRVDVWASPPVHLSFSFQISEDGEPIESFDVHRSGTGAQFLPRF